MDFTNRHLRSSMLIGTENIEKLKSKRIAVFGVGGVGGYVIEGLARSAVGEIDIIDSDNIDISNLNRQIIATENTINLNKVDAAEKRIHEIDSSIKVNKYHTFFNIETSSLFNFKNYDYVVDAIDTVTSKIELILAAQAENIPIISSMGTGNKLNPANLEISDIFKTTVCPLAKVMRYELKKRGVEKLKVVYSKEIPITHTINCEQPSKRIPASMVFVPAAAGIIIASEVIKDLINN